MKINDLLISQLQASITTLRLCIEQCPDDTWNEKVGNAPISIAAFHALFFADIYLERSLDTFKDQPYHKENAALFGDYEELESEMQQRQYEKADILNYLHFCQSKAATVISAETDETLAEVSGFPWIKGPRAEVHVYNARHVQHHAAQISLRLRLNLQTDIPWVKQGLEVAN